MDSPAKGFRDTVLRILNEIDQLDIINPEKQACVDILSVTTSYMSKSITDRTFDFIEYTTMCQTIGPQIVAAQNAAAQDQVDGMLAYLLEWRSKHPAEWDKMYVVCQCIWTVSKESAHEQIIKSTMLDDAEHRETHVIASENVPTFDAARMLLARILADRVLAAAVFNDRASPPAPNPEDAYRQNIYSLSTERDLLSQSIKSELVTASTRLGCPIAHSR